MSSFQYAIFKSAQDMLHDLNRIDANGACWHRLWIIDCDACIAANKNTISFVGLYNAAVNTSVEYFAAQTGEYELAQRIGDILRIGNVMHRLACK